MPEKPSVAEPEPPSSEGQAPEEAAIAPEEAPPTAPPAPPPVLAEFNRGAADAALGAAASAVVKCKEPEGPLGAGTIRVVFAPSGKVTSTQVIGAPFAGTSVGGCVAVTFRSAKVPPFAGAATSLTRTFTIN